MKYTAAPANMSNNEEIDNNASNRHHNESMENASNECESKENGTPPSIVNFYHIKKRQASQQETDNTCKRASIATVSPDRMQTVQMKKTAPKPQPLTRGLFQRLQGLDDLPDPISFMSNPIEMMCRTLGGGIDLIWIEQGSTEAFVNPFTSVYFTPPGVTKLRTEKLQALKKATRIFACAPRRVSKEANQPLYKFANEDKKFKKAYFIRLKTNG
jgi:hypothetical protein